MLIKKVIYFGEFGYLNSLRIKKKYYFNFFEFLERSIRAFIAKFLLVSGHHVAAQVDGHQHGVSIQISINSGKKFSAYLA